MKILFKNTSLLPPASMIPPFHILFARLFHLLPLLVLFHSFFNSFIHILLYFASFRFLLRHFATFRIHFASFRIHFASFRIISYFSRTLLQLPHWAERYDIYVNFYTTNFCGIIIYMTSLPFSRTRICIVCVWQRLLFYKAPMSESSPYFKYSMALSNGNNVFLIFRFFPLKKWSARSHPPSYEESPWPTLYRQSKCLY